MISFRQFLEAEAAPPSGMPPTGEDEGDDKINDFSFTTRELGGFDGLEPEDYLKAPVVSFQPIDQKGGPRTSSPVFIDVEDGDGKGGLTGKLMHSISHTDKMRNPNGTKFKGKPEDARLNLRRRGKNFNATLDDILLKPFAAQQQQGGMGGGL